MWCHKVNWATPDHNNAARCELLHENQHLGWIAADQRLPRSRGSWAPVTQSTELTGAADDGAQLPRLSSAWANNCASFGSFPAASRTSRSSMQPIAARRAGSVSPWHDQPEIRKFGWSKPLMKLRQGRVPPLLGPSSVTAPNLLSMTPAA